MSYPIYKASTPGAPGNHIALFVETSSEDGSGHRYHVTGTIQQGMTYEHADAGRPEESAEFVAKEYIGSVSTASYARIDEVLSGIEPPKKQFDGARRINPQEPLRRCGEWAVEAVKALREAGVLEA